MQTFKDQALNMSCQPTVNRTLNCELVFQSLDETDQVEIDFGDCTKLTYQQSSNKSGPLYYERAVKITKIYDTIGTYEIKAKFQGSNITNFNQSLLIRDCISIFVTQLFS